MSNVDTVIARTDWKALKEQKLQLVLAMDRTETSILCETLSPEESEQAHQELDALKGILHWIDHLQDAAELDGHPVQFTTQDEG